MFDRIKRKWRPQRVKQAGPQRANGQSLVEMAIIAPLLILLFIGVLEVGYAIRSYVVLVNADREATRFAARGLYLDYSQTDRDAVGYSSVLSHTLDSLAQQLPFDVTSDNKNGTLIVSHYVVDTGKPCRNPPCCKGNGQGNGQGNNQGNNQACDCSSPSQREEDYPDDDLILYPGKEGYEYFTKFYGIPRESRINFEELTAQLKEENDALNCALNLRDPTAPWSVNSGIVVETFYTQHQLLGVPIISNYFTDPYELYAHTVMRLPEGPIEGCEVFPIALSRDKADVTQVGQRLTDGWDGVGDGNFGWLSWNGETNAVYLREELENPRLAATDFTDALQYTPPDDDHALNAGDDVEGLPGVNFTTDEQIRNLLLQKRIIVIPVWDSQGSDSNGANSYYHIDRFIRVQVESPMDASSKSIALRLMEDPADVCPGNGW
jgi:hypothetical protein